jgi:anthranilate phosphoribosyltransferase
MVGLGHKNGIAVQGLGGGMIPTLRRRTRGIELHGQHQVPLTIEPSDFGLSDTRDPELPLFSPPVEGEGTDDNPLLVQASADIVRSVLEGESGPARSASLLGAAVILKAAGRALTLAEGVDQAVKSLEEKRTLKVLQALRDRA